MTRGPNAITKTIETTLGPLLVPTDMASEAVDIVMELAALDGHIITLGPEYVKTIKGLGKRISTFNEKHVSRDLANEGEE